MYAYFRSWRLSGTWEQIPTTLRQRVRQQLGRAPTPSAAILDSQAVKTTERGGPHGSRGYDGAKKLSGRQRHLLVDTLGLVLGVVVHPANIQERAGAPWLLQQLQPTLPRLELIWAANAYLGPLQTWVWQTWVWQTWVWQTFGWHLVVVASGCGQIRNRPSGSGASSSSRAGGWWSAPTPGSGATGG